jgi:YVTN family beta-propeller protein
MNLRVSGLLAIAAAALAGLLGSAQSLAQNAYIANSVSDNVSVIDTATNTVTATIPVGNSPEGVAVSPDGSKVYVANYDSNTLSVINTATNTVTATIPVGVSPSGVAVTPDGTKVYVANEDIAHPSGIVGPGTVSVIATAANTVTATIPVGRAPGGVAVTPDGTKVYVANAFSNSVSVIDTATNTVTTTIPAETPAGVAVTPDGSKVYVTNSIEFGTVSVIATATDTVIATIALHAGGASAAGVAVTPDGSKVYVVDANQTGSVSVISTATDTVVGSPIAVGINPGGVAVTPDGTKVYVVNYLENLSGATVGSVSVIATATNTVTTTVPLGTGTAAFGIFIQPLDIVSPNEVATTASGLAYSRVSRTFNGTVTITNISSSAISGPFQILFTALTAGVTLANATGNFSGSPYLTVPTAGGIASLMPGQSATVSVQFDDPSFAAIKFTPVIYSGSI